MMKEKKIILTIAGSDPSGGAGIQADLKTAVMLDVYPCSVITVVTAQNGMEFKNSWPVSVDAVKEQLDCVLSDLMPDAVKIGLIQSGELITAIAQKCIEYNLPNIVIDPVISPTLSDGKVDEHLIRSLAEHLFPLATLVTPNIREKDYFESIMGVPFHLLCESYLLKGGHSEGVECIDRLFFRRNIDQSVSMPSSAFPTINHNHSSLFSQESLIPVPEVEEASVFVEEYVHKRISTDNTHGSGCVLSAAIACFLAQQHSLEEAVRLGIKFIDKAINKSSKIKLGKGNYGPALI